MGEMLAATEGERAKGGRPWPSVTRTAGGRVTPTLLALGLTRKEASRAEMLAGLPEHKQEAVIAGRPRNTGRPMTAPGTPYSFDRCDGCGGPLEPESRLWGLCPACERGPLSAENERDA